MTERQCTRCGYRTDSNDHAICLECHEGRMDLTHQEKLAFHNAILVLSNRYHEIAKAFDAVAIELCKMHTKDITEELAKSMLNRLPAREVDKQEQVVEYWQQRFFS